jgi:hypothetical protein
MHESSGKSMTGTPAFKIPTTGASEARAALQDSHEAAAETIAALTAAYPRRALDDVEELCVQLSSLTELRPPRDDPAWQGLYGTAHDMKGQGGSFGYPLITDIAASMCAFIQRIDRIDDRALGLLKAHISAMRAVLGQRISGRGGDLGEQLVLGLAAACAEYGRRGR